MEKPQLKERLSQLPKDIEQVDDSFRHQYLSYTKHIYVESAENGQLYDAFQSTAMHKICFLLANEKQTPHGKNSTQYQTHTPDHKVQSESKRRALSVHIAV